MSEHEQAANWMLDAARQMGNAAYVFSQSVCVMAEIQGMIALNQYRLGRGETIAYDEKAFDEVALKYGIHHNAVVETLRR